jgi:hypothetical protein
MQYRDANGRVYFLHRGISRAGCCGGKITYATYYRKASGSLKRVVTKFLPVRDSRQLAETDLAIYAAKNGWEEVDP